MIDYIETPRSKEDISRLLGLLNFFISFLPAADKYDEEVIMILLGEDQERAFNSAKTDLLNSVTLQHPSKFTQRNMDASATHVGGALVQEPELLTT